MPLAETRVMNVDDLPWSSLWLSLRVSVRCEGRTPTGLGGNESERLLKWTLTFEPDGGFADEPRSFGSDRAVRTAALEPAGRPFSAGTQERSGHHPASAVKLNS